MRSKKTPPEHGNKNMYMSMDKPIALSSTEGTKGPEAKNAKMKSRKKSPGFGNLKMNIPWTNR